MVGKPAWGYSELKSLFREEYGIRELGYISDAKLVALYRYSKALVFPSLYEGFGIPIVEAMSQRIPIIISNIPTSIELNSMHNMQLFPFELGDENCFLRHLEKLEVEWEKVRLELDYGDLSIYNYSNVAKYHLQVYRQVVGVTKS